MPMGSARTLQTSIDWGLQSLDRKNLGFLPLVMVWHMAMASAAAVASSRRDDCAMGMAVSSVSIVW